MKSGETGKNLLEMENRAQYLQAEFDEDGASETDIREIRVAILGIKVHLDHLQYRAEREGTYTPISA